MEQNFLKVIFIFGLLTFLVTENVILANDSCIASWSSLSFNKSVKFARINRPKWCPFENVTAYLTPGKSTGEVRLSGQSAISVPEGVYKCKNAYNTRFCPYYVTVKSIVNRI
ncbi:hypothetical protein EB796_017400 [Bugula neritina]|uniref:Uncharacterized protein n=1 Tax=Bugula neritina TaxID=10212 RepID=A0A7J7JFA2_BUGNE|nr:hypothetical protein EB796_017400 [Bugula neritina]